MNRSGLDISSTMTTTTTNAAATTNSNAPSGGGRGRTAKSAVGTVFVIVGVMVGTMIGQMRTAQAQTYMQDYMDSTTERKSGIGVHIEMIDVAAIVADAERGLHASLWFAGLSDFVFGVEFTGFFQQHETADERFFSTRIAVGFNAIEFMEGSWLRFELALHVGEKLIGKGSFADFGAGVAIGFPLINGPDQFPLLRIDATYSFAPFKALSENFMVGARLSLYPFPPGGLRPFGITAGFYFGEDRNTPWKGVYIGLIFGAPTGSEF